MVNCLLIWVVKQASSWWKRGVGAPPGGIRRRLLARVRGGEQRECVGWRADDCESCVGWTEKKAASGMGKRGRGEERDAGERWKGRGW